MENRYLFEQVLTRYKIYGDIDKAIESVDLTGIPIHKQILLIEDFRAIAELLSSCDKKSL